MIHDNIWTMNYVTNYPQEPDLHSVLHFAFCFSSFKSDGGSTDSNTGWIDEIKLE